MKALTDLKVADVLTECNMSFEDHWEMQDRLFKTLRRRLIEEALETERTELVCCSWHTRSSERKDYRNGYWQRFILLKDGCLDVRMPRVRSSGYESKIIPRYLKRMPEVDNALKRVFLFGISTRLTGEALKPLLGESISAQTISKIAQSLDHEVRRYHTRSLSDTYVYLFLDGIMLKVKTGAGAKKKAVLVAYGITSEGKRELIDFVVTKSESASAWEGIMNLFHRGLIGGMLRLIITDGNQALMNAVDLTYPGIPRQRCWAHKMRNVGVYLKKKDLDACVQEAREIYSAEGSSPGVLQVGKEMETHIRKAVLCIERGLEELLNFYACPQTQNHQRDREGVPGSKEADTTYELL
jgi:putative transposase